MSDQMEIVEAGVLQGTSKAPKPIKKRYLESNSQLSPRTSAHSPTHSVFAVSNFDSEPSSDCSSTLVSLSPSQKAASAIHSSISSKFVQSSNQHADKLVSNSISSIRIVSPKPTPSNVVGNKAKRKASELQDGAMSAPLKPKSEHPLNGLMDPLYPLYFSNEDRLEKIIKNALADTTNMECSPSSNGASLPTSFGPYDAQMNYSTLSSESNANLLSSQNFDLSETGHSSLVGHIPSILPSNLPYSSHPSLYNEFSLMDNNNNYPSMLAQTKLSMHQQNPRNKSYPFHVDMVTMAVLHHESSNNNINTKRHQKIQLRRRSSSMSANLNSAQEEPVDFSISKTYAQTSQNIINNVIDKLLAKDNSRVMLLA